jgi:hypothetical protein
VSVFGNENKELTVRDNLLFFATLIFSLSLEFENNARCLLTLLGGFKLPAQSGW